jgi:hypothetical protein
MAHGRIRWTPGNAARGLLTWAIDLWPYVNGKALTLGINLKEMEYSDMLDVIHYFFEEDSTFVSQEHLETREGVRKNIYTQMYDRPYKYFRGKGSSSGGSYSGGISGSDSLDDSFEDLSPVDPLKPPTKGYVPPTDFDPSSPKPFGGVLDAPIG